jgi:8-oxo-dGTP pyrophosphatase MutT (NUDIX family)
LNRDRALDLDCVREAMRIAPLELERNEDTRQAAVSAILRTPHDGLDPEILFIKRAERASDPWSGHIAFPGGRYEPSDPDLRATAVRETREEIGLDLDVHGELLGRLDDVVPGNSRGLITGLVVEPYVWLVRDIPQLEPNGIEVDELHWVALAPLLRGDCDTHYDYVWRSQPLKLPGYRIGTDEAPRIVWGMTHRMIETLFGRIRQVMTEAK